ncbi:MAG: hypothetical protein EBQ92_07740 [Proteobacteria bacterium]|nr:hypothetical protein [Pseudomonadota bacterium]
MKIITPSLIILALGLGVSACQSRSKNENQLINVVVPSVIRQSPDFRDWLAKKQLFLEITVRNEIEVIWTQSTPTDLSNEIEVPAFVFEERQEGAITVLVEVWDRPKNLAPTRLLAGSQEFGELPLEIYLFFPQPFSPRDRGVEFEFD